MREQERPHLHYDHGFDFDCLANEANNCRRCGRQVRTLIALIRNKYWCRTSSRLSDTGRSNLIGLFDHVLVGHGSQRTDIQAYLSGEYSWTC